MNVLLLCRKHSIDESLVRDWRKKEQKLKESLSKEKWMRTPKGTKVTEATNIKMKRFRIIGAGRKLTDENLEENLYQWIVDRRNERKQVSQKQIQSQALVMFQNSGTNKSFVASNGWVENFMSRYSLKYRQKTNQGQRLPDELITKVVDFLYYLRKYFANNPSILKSQITAMDETCVFLENVSNKTIAISGKFKDIFPVISLTSHFDLFHVCRRKNSLTPDNWT